MADFSSGVASYITGFCTIKVHFPIDFKGNQVIACKVCPYLSSNNRYCQLNKQPVHYPEKFVGDFCPLERVETDGNNIE